MNCYQNVHSVISLKVIKMAIIFVFTDEEEQRAKELGVNYFKLKDTTDKSLDNFLNNSILLMFMPFLNDPKEKEELRTNFNNQVIMRKIWKGN
jgi:hypothetical protein